METKMKIYNSLTRRVEEFRPNEEGKVKMYTCGPTVYHFAHIGNLRTYIMEDVLEKTLRYVGYDVLRAMNITDVGHLTSDGDTGDDKMLVGAKREHKTVMEIAKYYTDKFREDYESLNLKWPEIVVPATSCIDTYFEIISDLLEKGFAYKSEGNIYFDVSKLDEYYVLTNQNSDDMVIGARDDVSHDSGKHNQQDFVLWFTKSKFDNQELKWNSPWGVGYPGWHIECSGISYKYLGDRLDIHCGGVDNKFPHHTNEIAQSESFLGHKWCNYWVHGEHLNTTDGKMSKSKGEFLTVTLLKEKGYIPEVYKLFCLQAHYRRALTFSWEGMDSAKGAYAKIVKRISDLRPNGLNPELDKIEKFDDQFKSALSNDLNTSSAITTLFDVLKSDLNDMSKAMLVRKFDTVLGLALDEVLDGTHEYLQNAKIDNDLKEYIDGKIAERRQAKIDKNYALADSIRAELLSKGITLIDTPNGTEYKVN